MKTARRFTLDEIENAFRALLDADERLKSSNGSVEIVMTLLLHRLFRPAGVRSLDPEYA